jgi:hypothetical protein
MYIQYIQGLFQSRLSTADYALLLRSEVTLRLTVSQSVSMSWCRARSGCPSLILCRLAGRDPMQIGAAVLHADWLDGRTLGDWHLR